MVVKQSENHCRRLKHPEQRVVVVCMELPESYPDPHAHIFWSMVTPVVYLNSSERMSSMTLSIGMHISGVYKIARHHGNLRHHSRQPSLFGTKAKYVLDIDVTPGYATNVLCRSLS